MRLAGVLLAAVLTALLTGCGERPTGREELGRDTPAMPSNEHPTSHQGQTAVAVADLAKRLGVDDQEITVVGVEEVTWRDGSLGCPEPGRVYTQALVDGSRILLRHAGRTYSYHAAAGRAPFLCERPLRGP